VEESHSDLIQSLRTTTTEWENFQDLLCFHHQDGVPHAIH